MRKLNQISEFFNTFTTNKCYVKNERLYFEGSRESYSLEDIDRIVGQINR